MKTCLKCKVTFPEYVKIPKCKEGGNHRYNPRYDREYKEHMAMFGNGKEKETFTIQFMNGKGGYDSVNAKDIKELSKYDDGSIISNKEKIENKLKRYKFWEGNDFNS